MRRLRYAKHDRVSPSAVAFRSTDGAIAAAFGSHIVVFNGWDTVARDAGTVYDSSQLEKEIHDVCATSLSWSNDGCKLAAVGKGIFVWNVTHLDPNISMDDGLRVKYSIAFSLTSEDSPIQSSFAMGSISPDGSLISASAFYSRVGWVWAIPAVANTPSSALSYAEIVHGNSGVALNGLETSWRWKPSAHDRRP